MIAFQYMAIAVLIGALLIELVQAGRRRSSYGMCLIRGLTWAAAASAIWSPRSVEHVARLLGIRRGADLVLYVFILLFLGTTFYLYAYCRAMRRQVTELIRRNAIERARHGPRIVEDPFRNGPSGP